MVIGIWQEAIFRYIIMIVQVGMLKKGLVLSDTVSGMKASFLHLLGLIANNEKRYPQAIEYFSNAMEVCDNLNDKYRYSLSLGRVYSEVGQKKKS